MFKFKRLSIMGHFRLKIDALESPSLQSKISAFWEDRYHDAYMAELDVHLVCPKLIYDRYHSKYEWWRALIRASCFGRLHSVVAQLSSSRREYNATVVKK